MLSFAEKTAMRRIYSVIALGALLLAGLLPAGCERLDTPFGRSTGRGGSGLAQRDSSEVQGTDYLESQQTEKVVNLCHKEPSCLS